MTPDDPLPQSVPLTQILHDIKSLTGSMTYQSSTYGTLNSQVVNLRRVIKYAAVLLSASMIGSACIIAAAIWWVR